MALCSQNVGHVVTRSGKREAVPLVICTVARLYWVDRKIEKTHEWFERASESVLSRDHIVAICAARRIDKMEGEDSEGAPSTRSLTQRATARASRQTRLRDSGTNKHNRDDEAALSALQMTKIGSTAMLGESDFKGHVPYQYGVETREYNSSRMITCKTANTHG
ncbi:hypothetical protein BGY98DRAFT_935435 [Russula aff. rugulosa BPL654]|nr:hypothetical protein BGY98DRAFT_935435 [Russula aff. rugulosa BPL654]